MTLSKAQIPRGALRVAEKLVERGHGAWVVGGCVRDLLRAVPVSDWDLATSAHPEEVQKLFRRTIPTGIKHGTITVLEAGEAYEVTTLRGDSAYSDGRRPDRVEFVASIEEDLGRRDFTVNAIAFDPVAERIVDPWGGVADLAVHLIRAVRDPMERFAEDGLRVLRAARFVATLDMQLDGATEAAIRPNLAVFARVSRERVKAEWEKACTKAQRPSRAFAVMRRTGMLEISAPLLAALPDDAFTRGIARMDVAPPTFSSRLAALAIEIAGEPGALDAWLVELRASNKEREEIVHLCRTFRPDLGAVPVTELRAWMQAVGRRSLDHALDLEHADTVARRMPDTRELVRERVRAELDQGLPLSTAELAVTGQELIAALGLAPGPAIGELLRQLLRHCQQIPEDNRKERLLNVARSLAPAT